MYGLLFLAGILAGISNAIAGGGSFFTFPLFLAVGLPPIVANASNSIAVWPGHALAVVGYRKELRQHSSGIGISVVIAFLGAALGAVTLTLTGNETFIKLIPFLILFSTLLFIFDSKLGGMITSYSTKQSFMRSSFLTRILEFIFAFYGGFFGAGLGVMLMAGLQILGIHDIQTNNALKNLLASIITSIAVLIFALSGVVAWSYTIVAFTGAVIGGLLGARIAQWLSAIWLRRIVIFFGLFLSIYYFVKYYY